MKKESKMKHCPKCKKVKSYSEFHKNKNTKDKHAQYCKQCRVILWSEDRSRKKKKFGGLYSVWDSMKQRCYNPTAQNYKDYGGRGITICKKWQGSFQIFYNWAILNGHKKGLSIDRRNNNGNYSPQNCRFVTHTENIRNSRVTKLTIEEVTKIRRLLAEGILTQKKIAELVGVKSLTIWAIRTKRRWADV